MKEHFAAIKQNPRFGYEKDKEIVLIWCQCKWQQEENGMNETETIEFCISDTIAAVNERLRMTRHPKE